MKVLRSRHTYVSFGYNLKITESTSVQTVYATNSKKSSLERNLMQDKKTNLF